MSLVFLADDFPPEVGGIQTYVCELARAVSALGEEVIVVASRQPGDEQFDAELPFRTVRVHTGGSPAAAAMNLASGAGFAAGQTRKPARCIIATKWSPEGPAGLLVRRRLGCPLVLLGYGGEFSHSRGSLFKWLVQRSVLRGSARCLAISGFTAELFQRARVPRERIGTIMGGVAPERFTAGEEEAAAARELLGLGDRRFVLTVARLVRRKGHDTVLDALPQVLEQFPELLYVVVGDGPMREELERRIDELGLKDSVMMTGALDDDRLSGLYSASEFLVMPSRPVRGELPEGLGLVFLEAAAAGVPGIGTDFGGIPDAVEDGVTGLLVPPDDAGSLAQAMLRLLGDDALCRQMGEAARDRVLRDFTWERVAQRLLTQLARLERGEAASS